MESNDGNVKTVVVFFEIHIPLRGYHPQIKQFCLTMYLKGMGFRAIERVTGIAHTTIMNWVKELGEELPEDESEEPELAELDELQTNISDGPRATLWKSQRLLLVVEPIRYGFGQQLIISHQELSQ